jgi:Flp pilus assembly protein CpaB
MKPKTMILMIVAVTCGLGASYMTSRLLAERGNAPDETEKVSVLVARKSLEMGSILKNPNELFEEKQFTRGEEPKNGLVDPTLLKGRQLKRPLRAGDYISEDDLFEKGKSGISGMLPEGHLAVGIKVTPDSVAGGFASLPHSKVDIFSTVRRGDDKSSYSMLLLEDVLVLAADGSEVRDADNKAKLATVVTVALRPDDVAKVRLAEQFGPITLALRGFGAKKLDHVVKQTLENIVTGSFQRENILETPDTDPAAPPVVSPLPVVPNPKAETIAIEQKDPRAGYKIVRTRIENGTQTEFWDYTFNEKGEVVECRQVIGGIESGTASGIAPPRIQPPASTNPKE